MSKRGKSLLLGNIAVGQIFLIVMSLFALTFVISDVDRASASLVRFADADLIPLPPQPVVPRPFSLSDDLPPVPPVPKPLVVVPKVPSTVPLPNAAVPTIAPPAGWDGYTYHPSGGGFDNGYWQSADGTHQASTSVVAQDVQQANQQTQQTGTGKTDLTKSAGVTVGTALVDGLIFGVAAFGAGQLIGNAIGFQSGETLALSAGLAAAAFSYEILTGTGLLETGGIAAIGAALAIGAVIFVLLYEKEAVQVVGFSCLPWEPPLGGENCEECNGDPFKPCSEYRCKSLGQACGLVNEGSEEEKCVWLHPDDVNAPVIRPVDEALKPLGLRYTSHETLPPSRGTRIIDPTNAEGCLRAFTPLEFGIELDEPGQCKIDFNRTRNFEAMRFFVGEKNFFLQNHTQKMRLPNADDIEAGPIIQNDGTMDLFVRCQDANGNLNEAEYNVRFCVDTSPDTTPPLVEGSSIPDGSPVRSGIDNITLDLYINEPSECKWSIDDRTFDEMENSMSCDTSPLQLNGNLQYICSSELSGIKDLEDNTFFFRCKDQPGATDEDRNVMVQSHKITLKGTEPLNIVKVLPNETVFGSTTAVTFDLQVETDDGAEQGKAVCQFSQTGEEGTYEEMFDTNSFIHEQTLGIESGSYSFFFRCVDAGGNSAEANISFNVFVDTLPPIVTRTYKQEGPTALKIVTHEEAKCVYSFDSCNYEFEDGIAMINNPPVIKDIHFAEWQLNKNYYIKCEDDFGNRPSPNVCSSIVSATQLS